jgi:hypothetical protein
VTRRSPANQLVWGNPPVKKKERLAVTVVTAEGSYNDSLEQMIEGSAFVKDVTRDVEIFNALARQAR